MKIWTLPCFLLVACVPQRASDLPYRSGSIQCRADGSVEWARLAQAATFDGVPCADWVRFHGGGRLDSCVLAQDWSFGARTLPAGATVFLDPQGVLLRCWLRHDLVLDGVPCEGGAFKSTTSFHPNGRLHFVFLSEDHEIQGVPCEASPFHPVELDAEGRLVGCKLARAYSSGGQSFARGALVRVDASGTLRAE